MIEQTHMSSTPLSADVQNTNLCVNDVIFLTKGENKKRCVWGHCSWIWFITALSLQPHSKLLPHSWCRCLGLCTLKHVCVCIVGGEWQVYSHCYSSEGTKNWHAGIKCMFSLTMSLETKELEEIVEERFGENPRIISLKQTQFEFKQVRNHEGWQEKHEEILRLHKVEIVLVAGQGTSRHQSSARDNFLCISKRLLSTDCFEDPLSMYIGLYTREVMLSQKHAAHCKMWLWSTKWESNKQVYGSFCLGLPYSILTGPCCR